MDISSLGIAAVAAITTICYLVGLAVKATPCNNDKYIPIACGAVGGILGLVALYTGLPNFPATDPLTAIAVGIVSGLAATGVNQAVKQLSGGK
ncbi:phage holin family protein [Oscillibacter sp.]|uniref:phage holin family protein n=1 Tax=Oscillibacter sp. TaxID=1945593 RepID=UPI00339A831B